MKVTPGFKQQIQKYLDERAKTDILFAPIYDKENKNIDDCIMYILNEVKKKAGSDNAIAMTDEEIYSIAVHYYDEDNIKVSSKINAKVSHISDSDDHSDDIDDEVDETTTQSNLTPEIKRKLILDDDEEKGLFD